MQLGWESLSYQYVAYLTSGKSFFVNFSFTRKSFNSLSTEIPFKRLDGMSSYIRKKECHRP